MPSRLEIIVSNQISSCQSKSKKKRKMPAYVSRPSRPFAFLGDIIRKDSTWEVVFPSLKIIFVQHWRFIWCTLTGSFISKRMRISGNGVPWSIVDDTPFLSTTLQRHGSLDLIFWDFMEEYMVLEPRWFRFVIYVPTALHVSPFTGGHKWTETYFLRHRRSNSVPKVLMTTLITISRDVPYWILDALWVGTICQKIDMMWQMMLTQYHYVNLLHWKWCINKITQVNTHQAITVDILINVCPRESCQISRSFTEIALPRQSSMASGKISATSMMGILCSIIVFVAAFTSCWSISGESR